MQAVPLGGQPLKRRTGIAGEEVEYAAGGRTGPEAPSGKGAGVAGKAHHPGTPTSEIKPRRREALTRASVR